MDSYEEVSKMLLDMANVSAGIAAYETPAKPMENVEINSDRKKRVKNRLKRMKERRGE